MRIYKVPYNFKHEEKIFGGYLSLRQAIYLIIGFLAMGIFFIPFTDMFSKSFIFVIIATVCVLFAFLKLDETNADRYFIYILKFLVRQKQYILEEGKEK